MKKNYVSQTSWGFTTRSIGIVIMIHGDNKGLVLPPKVAPVQIVIIPVFFKKTKKEDLIAKCKEIQKILTGSGLRVEVDDRDSASSGRKYNEWEMKGVPIRLELGPKDF